MWFGYMVFNLATTASISQTYGKHCLVVSTKGNNHSCICVSTGNIQGNDWRCWFLPRPVLQPDWRNCCHSFRIQALSVRVNQSCVHSGITISLNELWQERVLLYKQWLEDIKTRTGGFRKLSMESALFVYLFCRYMKTHFKWKWKRLKGCGFD